MMKSILFFILLMMSLPVSAGNSAEILIYGDDSCKLLKKKLSSTSSFSCLKELPRNIPKVVFLTVNSLKGINPHNRKNIVNLKEKGIYRFAVVLMNTRLVNDAELLELETLELIESMNAIGLLGDDMPFFLDYSKAPYDPRITIDKGIKSISKFVNNNQYWNWAFKQRK